MIRNKPAIVILLMLLLILIGLVGLLTLPGCQGVRISPSVRFEKPHRTAEETTNAKARAPKEETVTAAPEATETPQSTTAVENTTTAGTTTTTLKVGDTGKDVKRLQQRLTDLRYSPGPIDGRFSGRTYHAVIAFQKVNGLHRDGVVGPNTLRALSHPKTISARRSGNHIEVSKTLQVLLVVKGGKVAKILPCSTGKPGFRTPSVASAVDWKAGHYYESKKYGGTMVWASFFYGGVAVHGFASVPAYPASHGCVRIPIPDSKYVYDTMPVGSMVYVY
ncbi:MAG: L,D-transpeptidase family protein [Candidatus Aquicultor sp.]